MSKRESSLPVWAQNELKFLRSKVNEKSNVIKELEAVLFKEFGDKSSITKLVYLDHEIRVHEQNLLAVRFNLGDNKRIDVKAVLDKGEAYLSLRGTGNPLALSIEPEVANSIKVKVK